MRIPAGHIGLERQQDFGRCPHSCIGEGWALRLRRRPDKYTIETTETGHTPQKPPQSTTYIAKFHHGLNARKMGNKLILGGAGIEDGGRKMSQGTRNTTHSRSMVFLLSIGSIFKSGPERIRQPFPRGNGSTESGFSLRKPHPGLRLAFAPALTLLPDEKEQDSQPPDVVFLAGEAFLRMSLPSKHYGIKMTDFVRFILILYSSIFEKHAPQSIRFAYDSLSISRLDTRIFTAVP